MLRMNDSIGSLSAGIFMQVVAGVGLGLVDVVFYSWWNYS